MQMRNAMALEHPPSKSLSSCIIRTISIGVGGILLLVLFLMTFLHVTEALKFIPWIIAFNSALTGFSLVDKTAGQFKRPRTSAVMTGITIVMISTGGLALINMLQVGEILIYTGDLIVYLVCGIVFSFLGAVLAIKNVRLKNKTS